ELTDIKRVALQLEEIQQILLILQKITNTLRDKALK
ncbi:MAG: hypothetical protein QG593_411, partial [Patescibacteria group bacterium]|nr:hypothetical protein [Patescibacteria group bacterium]